MESSSGTIRLNKFLANAGLIARRKITDFLKENKVEVNGKRIFEPGVRVNPVKDEIRVNGQKVLLKEDFIYFLLNKPPGVISTTSDEHGRRSVVSFIPSRERLYPIGRLDQNTTGLILLTNDGALANRLTHPRYRVSKTYQAKVVGKPTPLQLNKLRAGVYLKDGKTAPAEVSIIGQTNNRTVLQLILHEGKNHEVKRMCSKVGLEILELKRVAMGPLELGDLPLGRYRELTRDEVLMLKGLS